MAINRLAIATCGYEPGATYFRGLIATYGYWNYAIDSGEAPVVTSLVTLCPNIIYYDEMEIFIDAVHEIDTNAPSNVVKYYSPTDGKIKQFTKSVEPRGLVLSGKITDEDTIRRKLNYLREKQVYIFLGATTFASLARIKDFKISKSVSTYVPITLIIACDSEIEGQFKEAEAASGLGTNTSDEDATGGYVKKLSEWGFNAWFTVTQSDFELPEGNYRMFARIKADVDVTNDIKLLVYNDTDLATVASTTATPSTSYAHYFLDFTIDSGDSGDSISFSVTKDMFTANNICVDYLGFVKV